MSSKAILFVPAFLSDHGGFEQYVVDLARLANDNGWRVTVAAPRDVAPTTWTSEQLNGIATLVSAEATMRSHTPELVMRGIGAAGSLRAQAAGRKSYGDPMSGRVGHLLIEQLFWKTAGRALLREADIVHTIGKPKPFVRQAINARKRLGGPVIYSEVAQVTHAYANRPDLVGFREVAPQLDAVLAYYAEQGQAIRDLFAYPGRIEIVEQWVSQDTEERLLSLGHAPRVDGRPVRFGSLSRLGEEKGLVWLVECFALALGQAGFDAELWIGGTGSMESEIRSTIERLDLTDHVTLTGYCEDKVSFLESIDVFVVSSREEGGPISGLEAMAAGRRVLSTRVGAMPDRLAGSADGTLVDFGDNGAMIDALTTLSGLTGSSRATGDLRERYSSQHSRLATQAKVLDVWTSCVCPGRASTEPRSVPDSSPNARSLARPTLNRMRTLLSHAKRTVVAKRLSRVREVPTPLGTTLRWRGDARYPTEFLTGDYEPELFSLLRDGLEAGDTFLDIGANAGYVSLVVKTLVAHGRVVAVEPIPANLATIRAMAALNPNHPIEVIEAAACASSGLVRIDVTRNLANARLAGVDWEMAKPATECIEVPGMSLDDLVGSVHPAVIKIDIEGAEVDLLAGSTGPVGWRYRPMIVVEYHGVPSRAACCAAATAWRYEARVLPSAEHPDVSGLVVMTGSTAEKTGT